MHSYCATGSRLRIHAASEVVGMDESPQLVLRNKKDSSMRVTINLVKNGEAAACVSAGNTGALMATARYVLKMLPGIDRPAIASFLPTVKGQICMLDLGANVDCRRQPAKHRGDAFGHPPRRITARRHRPDQAQFLVHR